MIPCDTPTMAGKVLNNLSATPAAFIVYGANDARRICAIAAETSQPVALYSAPFAAGWAGPSIFLALIDLMRAEFPGTDIIGVLDCGDRPGQALAAIRAGVSHIRFRAKPAMRKKMAAIAAQAGSTLVDNRKRAFDPNQSSDPDQACRVRFLAKMR